MSAGLWLCRHCGAPGVRNLGTNGYCTTHLHQLYLTFNQAVFALNGVGLQDGRLRPDWGPGYADLACIACDATWVGIVGEPCDWCSQSHQIMLEHQAAIVLTPPDPWLEPVRYQAAMHSWAARMANAILAGLITKPQADQAWQRGLHGSRRTTAA